MREDWVLSCSEFTISEDFVTDSQYLLQTQHIWMHFVLGVVAFPVTPRTGPTFDDIFGCSQSHLHVLCWGAYYFVRDNFTFISVILLLII